MNKCKNCGHLNDNEDKFCAVCGFKLNYRKKESVKFLVKLILSICLIFCTFLFINNSNEKIFDESVRTKLTSNKDSPTILKINFTVKNKENGFNNSFINEPLLVCFKNNKDISIAPNSDVPNDFPGDVEKDMYKNHNFGTFDFYRNPLKGNIIDINCKDNSIKKINLYNIKMKNEVDGMWDSKGDFYVELNNGKTGSGTFRMSI